MSAIQTISTSQRFTRQRPCPICGGHADLPQGKGVRCAGYLSSDGDYAHCQREQHAGSLPIDEKTTPATYAHKLHGPCKCGVTHGPGAERPNAKAPQKPIKRIEYPVYDLAGKLVGVHARIEYLDQIGENGKPKKTYTWARHNGRRAVEMPLFDAHKLQNVQDGVTVIVCEGEPAALACQRAKVRAVATYGAEIIPQDEHLRPLCRFNVVLWPDADEPGRKHMHRIADRLRALGATSIRFIEWTGAPAKGDAADFFAGGGTLDELTDLMRDTLAVTTQAEPRTTSTAQEGATVRAWPKKIDGAAYYGVLGSIACEIEPYIEADSAALLVSLLITAGTAMGRGPHMYAGAAIHRACLFGNVIGESGDNKSDSWWPVSRILEEMTATTEDDQLPLSPRRASGLSTGEGLLHQIRDERREERANKDGEIEEVVVDAGVKDKRLLNVETEFARVLAVMNREGNTLSMVLRELYDGAETARSSPKGNPITATGGHVGMIGHITPAELARKLHDVELFNGFANRFMWVLTHREKSMPNPPPYTKQHARRHAEMLAPALARAHGISTVTRDEEAQRDWAGVYESLRTGIGPDGKPTRKGMAKEVCARAHVQVMRISLIFAALDGSHVITAAHQEAALAVWDYCEACAAYLFSQVSGDPTAEVIHTALVERGQMTRTEISKLFSRHVEHGAIQAALDALTAEGRASSRKESTSGGPRELWEVAREGAA